MFVTKVEQVVFPIYSSSLIISRYFLFTIECKICLILWQRVAVATRDYYVCIIIAIFLLPPFLRRRSSLCIFWRNSHRHTVNFLLIHWHGLRQNCSHSQNWYKLRKKPLFEMHIDKFVTCIGTRTIAGRLNCNPNGICREMQIQFR